MKIRTFIALEIPDDTIQQIFNLIENHSEAKLFKWENKDKIHLTLKFIGNIEFNLIPELIHQLQFLNEITVLKLSVSKFGMFYHKKQPKIFWAGLEISEQLMEIVNRIENVLLKYGIEKEEPNFKPHLTLLRIKNNNRTDFLAKLKELKFEPIVFHSDKIIFYQSKLHPSGSVYEPLHIFHLKKLE
jgi:2'-5' RNA ligase